MGNDSCHCDQRHRKVLVRSVMLSIANEHPSALLELVDVSVIDLRGVRWSKKVFLPFQSQTPNPSVHRSQSDLPMMVFVVELPIVIVDFQQHLMVYVGHHHHWFRPGTTTDLRVCCFHRRFSVLASYHELAARNHYKVGGHCQAWVVDRHHASGHDHFYCHKVDDKLDAVEVAVR